MKSHMLGFSAVLLLLLLVSSSVQGGFHTFLEKFRKSFVLLLNSLLLMNMLMGIVFCNVFRLVVVYF